MSDSNQRLTKRQVFAMARREQTDPIPFYEYLAQRAVDDLPFDTEDARVLDLGCGPGHYTRALRAAGAFVVPMDLNPAEFTLPGGPPVGQVVSDATRLPVPTASVDGVFCSNMLEHTPDTAAVLAEIERVLRPGGWAWVSWTNWFSPWGGHEITPFHYLGPRLGLAAHTRLRGRPAKNVPGEGLFPVHIGTVLSLLSHRPGLRVLQVVPRYYPSQRWVMRVPWLREVAAWNCVIELSRTDHR